jgi:hypothetical protein
VPGIVLAGLEVAGADAFAERLDVDADGLRRVGDRDEPLAGVRGVDGALRRSRRDDARPPRRGCRRLRGRVLRRVDRRERVKRPLHLVTLHTERINAGDLRVKFG